MSDPTFENRDPNSPGFWDERFDQRFTPWDQAGVLDAFKTFVEPRAPENVLIRAAAARTRRYISPSAAFTVRAIDSHRAPLRRRVRNSKRGRTSSRKRIFSLMNRRSRRTGSTNALFCARCRKIAGRIRHAHGGVA